MSKDVNIDAIIEFTNKLIDLIEEKKLSQTTMNNVSDKQIAEQIGMDKSTLSHYASAVNNSKLLREPTITNAIKIADYFGVSLDYLFGRTTARSYNDPDIQNACDATGLSYESIEALNYYKEHSLNMLETINKLIEPLFTAISLRDLHYVNKIALYNTDEDRDNDQCTTTGIVEFPPEKKNSITEQQKELTLRNRYENGIVDKIASGYNGDTILQLIDIFLHVTTKKAVGYLVTPDGEIHPFDFLGTDKTSEPQMVMSGGDIADNYLLSKITEKLKELRKNETPSSRKY
jgi:transcriptional regulator with XRE-family HTH domain